MNQRLLQSSFVGVWEKPILNLPPIDRKLLLDIYGDPYYTNIGLGPEGMVISHLKDEPIGNILFNANRIQISSQTYEYTSLLTTKFYDILRLLPDLNFIFPFSSIGINSDFEFSGFPIESSEWLKNIFFKEFEKNIAEIKFLIPYHVRFEMKTNKDLKLNIGIQISPNEKYSLIVSLNDDRFWSEKPIPTKNELEDFYLDSHLEFNTYFKKLLNFSQN